MATTDIQTKPKVDDVIRQVERMNAKELDKVALSVQALRARHRAHVLSTDETAIFKKINATFPPKTQKRFDYLVWLRQEERISPDELVELIRLTERSEQMSVDRLRALVDLAD